MCTSIDQIQIHGLLRKGSLDEIYICIEKNEKRSMYFIRPEKVLCCANARRLQWKKQRKTMLGLVNLSTSGCEELGRNTYC
jgi:hypothetical protein